jgi:hypothetical protein
VSSVSTGLGFDWVLFCVLMGLGDTSSASCEDTSPLHLGPTWTLVASLKSSLQVQRTRASAHECETLHLEQFTIEGSVHKDGNFRGNPLCS